MEYELPADASELSFVVASVLQLPLERRQQFLESTSTSERLQQEIAWLQRGIKHFASNEGGGQIARPIDTSKAREEVSRN
jgi:ATP-dependent Lon protease